MCYKSILAELKAERMAQDAKDAADAKAYFRNNLACAEAHGCFEYKKSGKTYVLSKNDKVAAAWRGLLQSDPQVALATRRTREDLAPPEQASST